MTKGPVFKILTLRKQPQAWDWLWQERFDRIDRLYDCDHVVVTEPLQSPSLDTVKWMNRVFTEGHYYVRWDSDIVLGNDTFQAAYEMVKKGEADMAGVNGWQTVTRKFEDKDIDSIVFCAPFGWVDGVDSFWIVHADKWPSIPVEPALCHGWGDAEKDFMKRHLECWNLDYPYLHFGKKYSQLRFVH